MHASLHKSRRENHRRVVFTQQETIYSRAHLVLTNLLITSLLVLCFSRWFLLFLPPNILLISCHPRLLFWYLLFRYRWAHHLCFLSMNDLSRSSFFDNCNRSRILHRMKVLFLTYLIMATAYPNWMFFFVVVRIWILESWRIHCQTSWTEQW